MDKLVLGIDFGTTKTMAAWVNPKTGHHEVINLGEEHNYIPTTVYVENDGSFLFGEAADDSAAMHPEHYCRGFKMRLGTSAPALLMFCNGKPRTYTAKQLAAVFLKHVKDLCESKAVFEKVDSVVITRPVNFSPAQEDELRQAAEEAGFKEICFITEPEAAGYAFCSLSPESAFSDKALIVDWGGGTLDMAVVERNGEKVKLSGEYIAGDNDMGGEAYDSFLWDYTCAALPPLREETQMVQYAAQIQMRKTKEVLSKRENRRVQLSLSSGAKELNIERGDFENLIRGTVCKAAQMAKTLVGDSSRTTSLPEMLLLVGGTSLIPLVRTQLESHTGLPARQWQYTREAVAIGAALWQKQEISSSGDNSNVQGEPAQKDSCAVDGSEPCLEYGDAYCYGLNGCPQDFRLAVQWYARGNQAGDLNCAFALYDAYANGFGVPKDESICLALARNTLERGCPVGHYMLAELLYRGGGVPLDVPQARNCYRKAVEECQAPVSGISEELRLLVLINSSVALGAGEEAVRWMRLYGQLEKAKFRNSMLAMAILYSGGEASPQEKSQLRSYLDSGCSNREPISMWLKGKLLAQGDGSVYPTNVPAAVSLLTELTQSFPLPHFMLTKALATGAAADFEHVWRVTQYGASCLLSDSSLPCDIRLCPNEIGAVYHVYERSVANALLQQNLSDEIIDPVLSPRIVIRNNSQEQITSFRVRICIPETSLDKTVCFSTPIKPQQEYSVYVDQFNIPLGEKMRIEVEAAEKKTALDFADIPDLGIFDFLEMSILLPPLVMTWERGFFGGMKLFIQSPSAQLSNIVVRKESGACSNVPASLQAGAGISFGWSDFSDGQGLKEEERFYVTCEGYPPLRAWINTTLWDGNGLRMSAPAHGAANAFNVEAFAVTQGHLGDM